MTQQYVGTKIITGWEAEKDGQPGYGVKYADGYTSWSPKATFEEAYIPLGHIDNLPLHQQRVIAEKAELDTKLGKLLAFVETETYSQLPNEEKMRLYHQSSIMHQYSTVLGDRIAAF